LVYLAQVGYVFMQHLV